MAEYTDAVPIAVPDSNIMAMQHQSEIMAMVDTAHKYPRDLDRVLSEAESMATVDAETAQDMFYSLKRKGRNGEVSVIEGYSVRLAEVFASAWGNLRFGSKIVHIDNTMITAQAFCYDLEKNTGGTTEVQRRITTKDGKRFGDDMIVVTGNAACSIALRNAIGKVIPRSYLDRVFRKAMEVANGQAIGLDEKRQQAFTALQKMGVSKDRILASIGRQAMKEVTWDDIRTLHGFYNAAKDGEQTLEELFPEVEDDSASDEAPKPSAKGATNKAKEALKKQEAEKPAAEPQPKETAQEQELPLQSIPAPGSEFSEMYMGWPADRQKTYDDTYEQLTKEGVAVEHAHKVAYEKALP